MRFDVDQQADDLKPEELPRKMPLRLLSIKHLLALLWRRIDCKSRSQP